MKILVTGGSGFIGSNFVFNQLKNTKNKILNIDKLSYASNYDASKFLKNQNYKFFKSDICDFDRIKLLFHEFEPDVVVNFAAESHVDRSINAPMDFINTNIVGTATILNASLNYVRHKKSNNFKFIHISTDEVFGSLGKDGVFSEESPYNPSSPYSASKASSDHLVRAWSKTYDLPTIISNCTNNYGPFQFTEKLIPLMIVNCIDEKPLPVYGNGSNVRDWLYVDDHCSAIDLLIKDGQADQTYCLSGNSEYSNIEIIKKICKIIDKLKPRENNKSYTDLIKFVDDRPGHDFRYALDSSKIKNNLGWRPNESLDTGLSKTINWYINNESWWRRIQKMHYNQERLGIL